MPCVKCQTYISRIMRHAKATVSLLRWKITSGTQELESLNRLSARVRNVHFSNRSTAAACDGSTACAASGCVTSLHARGDKVPPASSARYRGRHIDQQDRPQCALVSLPAMPALCWLNRSPQRVIQACARRFGLPVDASVAANSTHRVCAQIAPRIHAR
jgi:hypothetical protein